MKIQQGDIWLHLWDGPGSAIAFTSNGVVKTTGDRAVMGKGTALEALNHFPDLDIVLGKAMQKHGNRPFLLARHSSGTAIMNLPTKGTVSHVRSREDAETQVCHHMIDRFIYPCDVTGWALKSDPDLICYSLVLMQTTLTNLKIDHLYLPIPGIGNGELSREAVVNLITPIVGDDPRFNFLDLRG